MIQEPANRNQLSEEPSRTLHEIEGETYFDGVSLGKIANQVGTPTYIYSAKSLNNQFRELEKAFKRVMILCYLIRVMRLDFLERLILMQ